MKIYMPGDHERSVITVPDTTKVERRYFGGANVLVINDRHVLQPFTEYGWRSFCKRVPEYHDLSEDGEYKITAILSNESLIAYAHFRQKEWEDVVLKIETLKRQVKELRELLMLEELAAEN